MIVQKAVNQNQRWFQEFLDKSQPALFNNVVHINLDDMRGSNPKCVQAIIRQPCHYYKMAKDWNKTRTDATNPKKGWIFQKEPMVRISFEGHLGANFVTPRGLTSYMANQLVGIQGIVTRMSTPRNHLVSSVHYCQKTEQLLSKSYIDDFSPEAVLDPKKNRSIPTSDIHNNPLVFEFGRSTFKDFQTCVIQELPQMAPAGQLPRSVNVILQDDLVTKLKPGDRVQLIGIYKLQPGAKTKESGIIKTNLICTSAVRLSSQANPLSDNKLSLKLPFPQQNVLQFFSHSICPSVFGHTQLKKAVLLMLIGGCEKNLQNATHLRGDINILMVGDPGTAKSQMLRWVLSTVEIGVNTTGSGASGVGLTAAITNDRDTGERNIEAGAMVLADRGFVCIDEFDKMNQDDRVAVHEVMEQQTVTIAKAGIHVSLNARCSVLAAANPLFGEYQRDLPPTKNIGMPDSLLSRFDLIFIILDNKDADQDKKIAERVCRNHMYGQIELLSQNNVQEDFIIEPFDIFTAKEEQVFQKGVLYKDDANQILTQAFLRKFIVHARNNVMPQLLDDSVKITAQMWAILRQKDFSSRDGNRVLPTTIRSYETLIRLSTAHAKLRLSSTIDIQDCIQAFRLMCFCIYSDEFALEKDLKSTLNEVCGIYLSADDDKIISKDASQARKFTSIKSEAFKPKSENRSSKNPASVKKEAAIKKEDSVIKKVHKIKINDEDQQVERVLNANELKERAKKLNSTVFVAITRLIRNRNDERISVQELAQTLPHMQEQEIRKCLRDLDNSEKILFDEEKDSIHAV